MGQRFSPLKTLFPTADDVLTAHRDTLDETVLRHLKTYEGGGTVHQPVGKFNRDYYVRAMEGNVRGLGPGLPTQPEYGEKQPQVSRRIQEALHRLTVKGYLMHNPDQPGADWIIITTEGEELLSQLAHFERLEKLGLERVKNALTSNQWYPQIADSEEIRELAWRWVRKKQGQGQASSPLSAEKTVFISYRRANFSWALAVFQDLTHHGFDVFFDYDGLASGAFEQAILGNIRARAHFLVVLTPSALDRCDEPADWLRLEIEAALDARRNIVPLLIDGFDFSTPSIASRFTGKLAALKQYNALPVPAAFFSAAMDSLRGKYLNVPLDAVLHPASPSAQRAATEQKAAATEAPAVSTDELLRTVRIPEETESATSEIARRRHLALSRFEAFHKNQPNWWYEKEVQQYHEIVAALEEAYGDDLSSFRVPDTMMEYKIISIQRGSYSGRPGSVQRSDKRSCEARYMRQQLDGLALYLQKHLSL